MNDHGASVYLLHFPTAWGNHGRHFLGVSERSDPELPAAVPHSRGWRRLPRGASISDVWECGSLDEAEKLYGRLKAQGSRRRLCSVCSPGNSRGLGTGNWLRPSREAQP